MLQTSRLEYITRTTSNQPATSCVIWLHGLGADCHDFEQILPLLKLPNDINARFIFPNAPQKSVTINAGFVCRAWYDIYSLADVSREDEAGIKDSQDAINALIQEQMDDGIPAERIIIAGFSQGGAMALYTGLQYHTPLAGILALSCYLPLHKTLINQISLANKKVPIRQCHGQFDEVLPIQLGQQSFDILLSLACNIEFQTYPIDHQVATNELQEIGQWMTTIFRNSQAQ